MNKRKPCGGRRKTSEPNLVRLRTPISQTSIAPPEPIKLHDFHCGECGLTLSNRLSGHHHHCPGKLPLHYRDVREYLCSTCPENKNDECQAYKKLHPDKDCIVSVGIKLPYARCPKGLWKAQMIECPKCTATLFHADRTPTSCKYCGWPIIAIKQKSVEAPIAITSLSPQKSDRIKQQRALKSWADLGLSIYAVNTKEEIEKLSDHYQVDRWIEKEKKTTLFSGNHQNINNLVDVIIEYGVPGLIINSDVEMVGNQTTVTQTNKNSLLAGIRHNYKNKDKSDAVMEPYGLDAFLLTPEMAQTLPEVPLPIGKPGWDYWIPLHFSQLGYSMDFIGYPYFFHETHAINWELDELRLGLHIIGQHYDDAPKYNETKFRRSLPYPPKQ